MKVCDNIDSDNRTAWTKSTSLEGSILRKLHDYCHQIAVNSSLVLVAVKSPMCPLETDKSCKVRDGD